MNRLAALGRLVACAVAAAPLAGSATPFQTPAVIGTLAAIDRGVYQCERTGQDTECRRKGSPAERIAGEAVTEIVLLYRGPVLVRTVFAFSEADFDTLADQLTAALGPPESGHESLKAGMAGVFENRFYVWTSDDQVWFAEQYFERVTTSGLWHMDAAEFAAFQVERDRARVHGARDL
jgi:hypothetical protein